MRDLPALRHRFNSVAFDVHRLECLRRNRDYVTDELCQHRLDRDIAGLEETIRIEAQQLVTDITAAFTPAERIRSIG